MLTVPTTDQLDLWFADYSGWLVSRVLPAPPYETHCGSRKHNKEEHASYLECCQSEDSRYAVKNEQYRTLYYHTNINDHRLSLDCMTQKKVLHSYGSTSLVIAGVIPHDGYTSR